MSCPTITIPLSSAEFAEVRTRLQTEHGILIPVGELTGDIFSHGAEIEWTYDGSSTLTFTVTSKPFFISCDKANEIVRGFFTE